MLIFDMIIFDNNLVIFLNKSLKLCKLNIVFIQLVNNQKE